MKVLPPLGIEPATSNAGGIEGTIGLLGCSASVAIHGYRMFNTRNNGLSEGVGKSFV